MVVPNSQARNIKGFTLIEVMVSMTILVILVIAFSQVIGGISSAWQDAQKRMDNFTKARALLSRLQVDVDSMVVRPDLATFPDTTFGFFTLRRGSGGSGIQSGIRPLSYVSYTFKTVADSNAGVRLAGALVRSDTSYSITDDLSKSFAPVSLAVPKPTAVPEPSPPSPPAANSEIVMSDGVLAFEWAFLREDGTYSPTYYYQGADSKLHMASGVAVALLVIDNQSASNLDGIRKLDGLLQDFDLPPAVASGAAGDNTWHPRKTWEAQLGLRVGQTSSNSVVGKYPMPFLRSIRAFERVYVFPSKNL